MIYLGRRKRVPTDYDIAAVARTTEGFSGAELEELVISRLYEAFADPARELRTEHLLKSAREIIPLSRSRALDFETLRQWAAIHCRLAAESEDQELAEPSDSLAARRARIVDI